MNPAIPALDAPAVMMRRLFAPIAEEMVAVEEILRRELRSRDPSVDELVRYGCLLGGKRLRPALLLLSAQACGSVVPEHLTLAAVVEMIHTATLVHDDVLDEADVRRHLQTVNARWGNEASVLLGDYLFTHAFFLASTLESTFGCRTIGRATNIVCEGELRQIRTRGNFDLTEAEYLEIIEAKTAELCACSCRLGAHYAGANTALEECLDKYGRYLGIAFQIADDLLDVAGDEAATGKSLGTDLEKQKPTLPVIRALSLTRGKERQQLLEVLHDASPARHGALLPWLERFEAIDYARDRAQAFARQARDQLAGLPGSPVRETLSDIAEFVVARSH